MDGGSIRGRTVVKSFYDRYGFDERDGPPEEDEEVERGYVDDPDEPSDELNYG